MVRKSERLARRSGGLSHSKASLGGPASSSQETDTRGKKTKGTPEDVPQERTTETTSELADKKYQAWSSYATQSPFPAFGHPTPDECKTAYDILDKLHGAAVDEEFKDPETPETIPHALDAVVVALLSQATSWNNAKRAMRSMKGVYGSVFAYDAIVAGGQPKLQDALRCGGLHVRKSRLLMGIFEQVRQRHGRWDLDHLFALSDDDAMKELLSYKGVGPKTAYVVLGWCLRRNPFTVDTHIYRIAGLWGWRPERCSRELAQSHLDVMVPGPLKFRLHFLLLQHGRQCPACRAGGNGSRPCEAKDALRRSVVPLVARGS